MTLPRTVAILLGCGWGGVSFAHGTPTTLPQFSMSSLPARAVHARWKAGDPLARGIEAWAAGKRERALRWFELAVHRTPADAIAWHNLGVALYTASRFDEALTAFRWERLLTPSAPSAWYGIGMCLRTAGHHADAENAFIVAINQAPREWEYWHRLAEVLTAQGKSTPAAAATRRAAELKPREGLTPRSRRRIHTSIMQVRIPRVPSIYPR